MSCCNKTYSAQINSTITLEQSDSSGCYVSRFSTPKTKVGKRVSKKEKTCCTEIDLESIKRKYNWVEGTCLDGVLTYSHISISSKEKIEAVFIPNPITIQALLTLIPKLTLKEASELLENRVQINTADCPREYCNEQITEVVTAVCPIGYTSSSQTIIISPCQFTSTLSIQDANLQASVYLQSIKQDFIATNVSCAPPVTFCNEFLTGSILKPNCYDKTPLFVSSFVSARELCGYYTQASANLAASSLLNSRLQTTALNADPSIYCEDSIGPPIDETPPSPNCGTAVLVGNIRNTDNAKILNFTYPQWVQSNIDLFETDPVVQVLQSGVSSSGQTNRFSLRVYRNEVKIIDSLGLIDAPYFQLVYNVTVNDFIRYEATFENFQGNDYIFETIQIQGCPRPLQTFVTLVLFEAGVTLP